MNKLKYILILVLLLAATCGLVNFILSVSYELNVPKHVVWKVDGVGEVVYHTGINSPGFTADIPKLLTLKNDAIAREFSITGTGGYFRQIELWVSSDRSVIWLTGVFAHEKSKILAAYSISDDVFLGYNAINYSSLSATSPKGRFRSRLLSGDINGMQVQEEKK